MICVCLVYCLMNIEDDDKVRMVLEKIIFNFVVCKMIKLLYLWIVMIEIVILFDGMLKENLFLVIF